MGRAIPTVNAEFEQQTLIAIGLFFLIGRIGRGALNAIIGDQFTDRLGHASSCHGNAGFGVLRPGIQDQTRHVKIAGRPRDGDRNKSPFAKRLALNECAWIERGPGQIEANHIAQLADIAFGPAFRRAGGAEPITQIIFVHNGF